MKRRSFLAKTAGLAATMTALPGLSRVLAEDASKTEAGRALTTPNWKLKPPPGGRIPVAVAISEGVTVIDFAGPWEVFQDTMVGDQMPFQLFTVAEKTEPLEGSAGLKLVPNHTFGNAPECKVVVVPAQKGSAALHEWLRKISKTADVTMSVCTGAFQLGRAGLLKGRRATTHHEFLDKLAKDFPETKVERDMRFVEGEKISTAGGLSSGIDLALRVVERYFGREAATRTAAYMEYQGQGWIT